ncbi:MAG: hypothetical protein IT323_01090 [Anaerolineae bacterium]|nr:hypothetical protein [Anaerolineae bacterium]
MDFERLLEVIDTLSPQELEQLKAHLARREQNQVRDAEAWGMALEAAAAEFRGDSSPEELADLFAAINEKSPPTDKGL